jgi:sugar lactone lactonase YvrE
MGNFRSFVIVLAVCVAASLSASAQELAQIYISNEWAESLQQLNFSTGELTTLYDIGGQPDDCTLGPNGQIIYDVPNAGTVDMFDPSTGVNTVLTTGIFGSRDLTLEPGGQTLLISKVSGPAEIYRYSFVTNTATVFFPKTKGITGFSGTAYDAYGNLYAIASFNTVIQINPATGAIINTLTLQPHNGGAGGDGLTYDSYSNSLWATTVGSSVNGWGLVQIPVQQSGFVSTTDFSFYPLGKAGAVDGVKSDGNGNLYIGAIHTALVYNIPSGIVTKNIVTKGADGVALVPGTYPATKPSTAH